MSGNSAAARRAGPAPKLKARDAHGVAEPGEVSEGAPDLLDLGTAEPERDQPLELRHENELAVSGEQVGESDELGMSPARPREAMDEQERGARLCRSIEICRNPPATDGEDDFLTDRIRKEGRERRLGGRQRQSQ
jgi:hypothetical protein